MNLLKIADIFRRLSARRGNRKLAIKKRKRLVLTTKTTRYVMMDNASLCTLCEFRPPRGRSRYDIDLL